MTLLGTRARKFDTLIDEVASTRAALDPLERYVREGSIDQKSRMVILEMMTNFSSIEKELFTKLEEYLGPGNRVFWIKILSLSRSNTKHHSIYVLVIHFSSSSSGTDPTI
jgi:hypothetical protein